MKRTIRLTENDLHRVIKECVKKVLSEGEGRLQSPKLEELIKQHGGIRKGTTWRIVIPYIKDEDIIGVYGGNFKGMGKYSRVDVYLENEVLDRELNRGEEILDLELNDGNSLYFIFDNAKGRYDRLHKSVYGDKTKAYRGYKWQNGFAQDHFHDKDIRIKSFKWTPEMNRKQMDFIKDIHRENMDDIKNNKDKHFDKYW